MDRDLILRKVGQAERALWRVKTRLPAGAAAFEKDYDSQDIVYRNFQIAMRNCVDIGSRVISERRWELPRTMGEVFDRLSSRRFIGAKLALSLRRMTALRNIIVHDYARIDLRKAFPLLKSSLKAVPSFCRAALRKAGA